MKRAIKFSVTPPMKSNNLNNNVSKASANVNIESSIFSNNNNAILMKNNSNKNEKEINNTNANNNKNNPEVINVSNKIFNLNNLNNPNIIDNRKFSILDIQSSEKANDLKSFIGN